MLQKKVSDFNLNRKRAGTIKSNLLKTKFTLIRQNSPLTALLRGCTLMLLSGNLAIELLVDMLLYSLNSEYQNQLLFWNNARASFILPESRQSIPPQDVASS